MCLVKMINESIKKNKTLKLDDKSFDKAIKIQGTDFDRKRRVKEEDRKSLLKMYNDGLPVKEIAKKSGISYATVLYNVDLSWRAAHKANSSGKHTGVTTMDFDNRVSYKRDLVKKGKLKIN